MIERDQVRRWLEEGERLQVDEVTAADGRWVLLVHYPGAEGPVNQIASPREGLLVVGRRTEVADDHHQGLRVLSQADFRQFNFHLVRDLMLLGVGYALDISDEARELRSFVVGRELREDQLTPSALMDALIAVHNGTLLATVHVRRAIGGAI